MWARGDSNSQGQRPYASEAYAYTSSATRPKDLVGALGFEPRVLRTRIVNVTVTLCPEYSSVGLPRIELGPYPPHGQILPLYYSSILASTIGFEPTCIQLTFLHVRSVRVYVEINFGTPYGFCSHLHGLKDRWPH